MVGVRAVTSQIAQEAAAAAQGHVVVLKKRIGQRKLIFKILVRCREHAEQTHPAAATAAPAPTAAQAGWVHHFHD